MVKIQIDGRLQEVPEGLNVLEAARRAGIPIPHFCYHPAIGPDGNCRMCLVEIEGLPKLDLACSTPVKEGMKVWTSTPTVLQARRDVLEFLLADHPLDCPICDKAGECKLQEYYDLHGRFGGRFAEPKEKKLKKLEIGRGLLLDRERCVLCTRCVRFLQRVTGTGELGVFERGVRTEIGIYEDRRIDNNYAGNLVDICPVGAITDRAFRFQTRAWFLEARRTVCPGCARGCAITVQSVCGYPLGAGKRKIFRITAAENPEVNGAWICDFGRYGHRRWEDGRRTGIELGGRASAAGAPSDWESLIDLVGRRLEDLLSSGRASGLTVVLRSSLTSEELALCRSIFVERLRGARIFFADPKPGPADGLLLVEERSPNARGARDLGFTLRTPGPEDLAAPTDLLLLFGQHLLDHHPAAELAGALEGAGLRVLFDSLRGGLDGSADIICPTALPVEKEGSFTNVAGLRQSFRPALAPPQGCRAEAWILERLAANLKVKPE